jgi:hypothetical protein
VTACSKKNENIDIQCKDEADKNILINEKYIVSQINKVFDTDFHEIKEPEFSKTLKTRYFSYDLDAMKNFIETKKLLFVKIDPIIVIGAEKEALSCNIYKKNNNIETGINISFIYDKDSKILKDILIGYFIGESESGRRDEKQTEEARGNIVDFLKYKPF